MFQRPTTKALIAALVAIVTVMTLTPLTASPASAASPTIEFEGWGYGHGRGLSQWGAQGYATRFGWNSARILDHYYGGTTAGQADTASDRPVDPNRIAIRLQRMAGRNTRVSIGSGRLKVNSTDTGARAVEVRRASTGKLEYRTSSSCGGFSGSFRATNSTTIKISKVGHTDPYTWQGLIGVCPVPSSDGLTNQVAIWYPGEIHSKVVGTSIETVNVTRVEHQLRSVVPRESPASWDASALRAQTVAARSYALSGDSRWSGYADTCDTIFCQVYAGWFWRRPGSSTKEPTTHPNTDAQISASPGLVRLTGSNRIARTEFSASSGGYTAGGTFPAVKDDGDLAVSPYIGWTASTSAAPLENAYGGGSQLTGITVTGRNGLGAAGGRVTSVRLDFASGASRTVSGNDVRSRLGLRSDWFRIVSSPSSAAASYITAVHRLFLGRGASDAEIARWTPVVSAGRRSELTSALSVSDEWAGVEIDNLYRKILGRSADSSGRAYWLERVRRGFHVEDIAVFFYGGDEYFSRVGRTNSGFVDRLYLDLLGRRADSGKSYWVGLLNSGELDRSGVAANFYASIESRKQRVTRLYRTILGRSPDPNGLAYWADQLPSIGDVSLAAYLASSQEYYNRTTR